MWRLKIYRGAWYAVTRIPNEEKPGQTKTRRKAMNTSDREVALRRFKDFEEDQKGDRKTISEILDFYRSDKTFKDQKSVDFCIRKLKPFFGHLRPDQIDRKLCREYTEKRKIVSVRKELETLRAAINYVIKDNKAVIELPPAPPPRTRYLTHSEYERLLAASVRSPHIKLFIILALNTGARATALLELTWDRVYFEHMRLDLANGEQTNKGRAMVPMNDDVLEALKEAYRGRTSDYVIEYGGNKVGTIIKGFKQAAERAGLEGVTPHVLRHTAAVWMAEDRIPIEEIAQFLGHSSTKVTFSVYARYSPDYLRNAANSLSRGSRSATARGVGKS